MTASNNPTDDIIELTEIVEEGIPLDKAFEDFAMDKAVDSKSLDRELDDLLRDAEPQPKAPPMVDEGLELDILFDEPATAAPLSEAAPAKAQPSAGIDMSDLDDLFDSLGLGDKEDGNTALDIILDGDIPQSEKREMETFYPSDSIDLDLPGLEDGDRTGTVQNLTDELLADIPEAAVLHSPQEPADESAPEGASAAETAEQTPALEGPVEDAAIMELTEELADEPAFSAEELPAATPALEKPAAELPGTVFPEPEQAAAEQPEPEQAAAELHEMEMPEPEAVDSSDARHAPPSPRVAPDSPEPAGISVQAAAPAETAASDPAIFLNALEVLRARLDALESLLQTPPALKTEDVLAVMPLSPQELPITQALRREILEHVEARVAELASNASVNGLQESVNALQSQVESMPDIRAELAKTLPLTAMQNVETQIEELRTLAQAREELQPEQILALLPQSPQGWPLAQALRQEIIEHIETRVAEVATNASVDGLQESVNALQSQVESIPDIRAELAKTAALSALQKMESEIEALRALVHAQEDAMSVLRQALTEKDATLAELSAGEARLREELAALAVQADSAAAIEAVRSELRDYVRQQAPIAAAKVIREEMQALLKELGG